MLTIIMHELSTDEAAAPIVCQLPIQDLFRTLRVIGEVPFIEPSPGTLLNLTHVERIYDDASEQAAADEAEIEFVDGGVPAAEAPEGFGIDTCPHGYIVGTCTRCAAEAGTTLSEQTRP